MAGQGSGASVTANLAAAGLTSEQVAQRHVGGLRNDQEQQATRSVAQILRANVLTRFNAILAGLLAMILIVGPVQDALFGLVLIANSGIGIFQELRAKRTLDRLTVLNAPHARAVRGGTVVDLDVGDVVQDDMLEIRSGDQV